MGLLIYAACKKENISTDPLLAESLSLRWSNRTVRAAINPIILDCKELLGQLNDATVLFIQREANSKVN